MLQKSLDKAAATLNQIKQNENAIVSKESELTAQLEQVRLLTSTKSLLFRQLSLNLEIMPVFLEFLIRSIVIGSTITPTADAGPAGAPRE